MVQQAVPAASHLAAYLQAVQDVFQAVMAVIQTLPEIMAAAEAAQLVLTVMAKLVVMETILQAVAGEVEAALTVVIQLMDKLQLPLQAGGVVIIILDLVAASTAPVP
jgi:hypothetical protein